MKKLSDKQWILWYIRMYNNPYDRYEGLGPEDHTKFKKLMKPYSKYKKYIFTLPESDRKAILNHKYDLKKNKDKMKAKLNQNETRKCKKMVKRYSVKRHQSTLKKYKSTRRALQKCKSFLNKTKKGGGPGQRMRRRQAILATQAAAQAEEEQPTTWNEDDARSRLYDPISLNIFGLNYHDLDEKQKLVILKSFT